MWTNIEQEMFKLENNDENIDSILLEEIFKFLKTFKNTKTAYRINKSRSDPLLIRLLDLINMGCKICNR